MIPATAERGPGTERSAVKKGNRYWEVDAARGVAILMMVVYHFTFDLYAFVFVATVGDRMVGFVSGELREGSPTFLPKTWASVDDVFVHPDHRNRGIGHALIASVEGWARQKGANGVSLQVAAANARGRRFYEELGFREISVYEVLEF